MDVYMARALELAREAADEDEVPVGAVVVNDATGEIIGEGRNRREGDRDPLAHAELLAIGAASRTLGGWRLTGCTLYVTLEPCPMCCGAIINARFDRVVFAAGDPKGGACGSVVDLFALPFNHRPEVVRDVMAEESAALLREFFKKKRRPPKAAL